MDTRHGIVCGAPMVKVKFTVIKNSKTVETEYFKLRLTYCNQSWYVESAYEDLLWDCVWVTWVKVDVQGRCY